MIFFLITKAREALHEREERRRKEMKANPKPIWLVLLQLGIFYSLPFLLILYHHQ